MEFWREHDLLKEQVGLDLRKAAKWLLQASMKMWMVEATEWFSYNMHTLISDQYVFFNLSIMVSI